MRLPNAIVNKAGDALRHNANYEAALDVLGEFRKQYVYPLNQAFKWLKKWTDKTGNNATYGQRLKRASSIVHKLRRQPNMNLSRMQDIGGCRVILSNYEQLRKLYNSIKSNNLIVRNKDYITYPKADGYRGIHLIYRCNSKNPDQDNLDIELQLRTKLQHAWATTIEVIDTFELQVYGQLKLGQGNEELRQFFYLLADEFARLENLPLHNNSLTDRCARIKELCDRHKIIAKLESYKVKQNQKMQAVNKKLSDVIKRLMKYGQDNEKWNILNLDIQKQEIETQDFTDPTAAQTEYLRLEKEHITTADANIVMVSAESKAEIEEAYPNYYADSSLFIEKLQEVLTK